MDPVRKLYISSDAKDALVRIADTGNFQARVEVARVIATLKRLEVKVKAAKTLDYWNVALSASGAASSYATAGNGTSLWRLHPTHAYCIALLVQQGSDLFVLDICGGTEIVSLELKYAELLTDL